MQYRKKPVVIEAVQWHKLGDHDKVERPWSNKSDYRCEHCLKGWGAHGVIRTLESTQDGGHFVCPGDWIITGVKGEHYACKPDIFAATYEIAAPRPDTGEGLVADLLGLATALDFEDRPINAEICREAARALGREEGKG